MDIKKDVQKQFGRTADAYVSSRVHRKGADLKMLIEMADLSGKETVLDVATGGGHTANALAPLVNKVTALDLTTEMLASAQKFIHSNGSRNVAFVQGDAEKLPFADEVFDLASCRIAPHHFPDVESFMKEIFRVLKPGGQFLLDDNVVPEDDEFDHFYNTVEKKRDISHYRAWKKSEWLRMLERNGFEVSEWHRFEKTFEFESWCERMQLPDQEKEKLNQFILNASERVKRKFRVKTKADRVSSFQGEAIVLKAVKF